MIRDTYGTKLKVYKTDIPRSVRAEEISAEGKSIFAQNGESRNRVKRVNLSKFTLLANLLLLLFQHIKNSGDYIFRCFQQSFVIMSRVL